MLPQITYTSAVLPCYFRVPHRPATVWTYGQYWEQKQSEQPMFLSVRLGFWHPRIAHRRQLSIRFSQAMMISPTSQVDRHVFRSRLVHFSTVNFG
jgi:hypothetical protein